MARLRATGIGDNVAAPSRQQAHLLQVRREATRDDTLRVRTFAFVPLWAIPVIFLYAPRRVQCPTCGVKVEKLPWAAGKNHFTISYAWFLATWCKRLSWKEVAEVFKTSWNTVFRSVEMAVNWGLAHRNIDGITAIGIDEICWRKRKDKFVTLVYQLDQGN